MKQAIIMCLLFGFAIHIQAQTVSIYEQVSRQPIPLANIYDKQSKSGTVSNYKGKADLSAFVGSDSIEIRCLGFKTKTLSYRQIEKAGFKVYLLEDMITLDAVVISASKWKQPRSEVPVKTTLIQRRDITLQNPQTAADLIGNTGEVYVQKSQLGGGSPMIRGFATNRLLISVDGVRMNTAIFRSGNIQNIISIDPLAIESAEVVFGPGSVIYGSDAIAGSMNFFTLEPKLSPSGDVFIKGSALARYASANFEKTGHADINIGFRKWAFLSSFSFSDFDDLVMGKHGPDEYLRNHYVETINSNDTVIENSNPLKQVYSGYHQYSMMQKIGFSPSSDWDFNYTFNYSATGDYSRYDRLIRPRGNTLRSAEWNYGPQIWMMNHFRVNHNAPTALYDNMSIHLSYQFFEESRKDRDLNKPIRHIRIEKVDAYALNFDFDKSMGEKHRFNYGAEAVVNWVHSTGSEEDVISGFTEIGPSRYPNESEWYSMALYAGHRFRVSPALNIQSGIRYNHYLLNATFDTEFYPFPFDEAHINNGALSGSIGMIFLPHRSWQLAWNVSTGFRSPNIDDIGKVFDSSPGFVIIPNPELQAEYAYNADLSLTKTIGDFMKLDITGFYTYLDNAIVRRNSSIQGADSIVYDGEMSRVQSLQNAAFATVYGVHVGIEAKLAYGVGASAHFNYQKGNEELDDGSTAPLRHAAPMFGKVHVNYTANRMKFDVYMVFNSSVSYENLAPEEQSKDYIYARDNNGNPYSPAWFTLNFKGIYQFSENLSLTAGIENILDKRYRPYSSGIAAPGRNFIVSVKAMF